LIKNWFTSVAYVCRKKLFSFFILEICNLILQKI